MIHFGTGGWRAKIGEEFTAENVRLLAQALAADMAKRGLGDSGIVIGYDRRFLSDKAARWIAEVMAGNGVKVYFIGNIAPTPLIMFSVEKLGTKYGVAVTASHNPADYNGIKVFTESGRDASKEVTDRLESLCAQSAPEGILVEDFEQAADNGDIVVIDPLNDYIDAILPMIDTDVIRRRGLKILLDPMFGVSKSALQTILLTARCQLDTINDRHDTLFGGRLPAPSAANLSKLRNMVLEQGYDLGIATDGDADRLGIIDDKGAYIHPNEIMVLLYYYLKKYRKWQGGVVRNVSTTHLLDRIAQSFGEKCYEVPVGFKYISSKMEETDAILGGESSGGLAVRGHINGKDGIFAGVLLVEMICATEKSISEMLEEIRREYCRLATAECDFELSEYGKTELMRLLIEDKKLPAFEWKIKNVSYQDGVKVYFENGGWVLTRFSGTEPLLRIVSEMPEEKDAGLALERMKNFAKQ